MGSKHHPYIRPLELGTESHEYTVKIVTDGTRTVAEVYEGDDEYIKTWRSRPVGVGHAVRRKGDRRDPSVGTTLAVARAFQSAADNAWDAVKGKL